MIPIQCGCGSVVLVTAEKVTRCKKCGTGHSISVEHVKLVRSDGEWVVADCFCEGCGKALLYDQAKPAGGPEDSCYLCAKCAKE
jgi:hypothetical protein